MTQREAVEWIAELFEVSPQELAPDTPRDDIPTWDSLGTLTLMASLDGDLGIVLSDEEVQTIRSVGDVLEVMRRNGKLT